jgi:transposase
VLINGATVTVKVAHVRLCHSRMLFVRAYPRETQEMVFDAHNRAFAFFKPSQRYLKFPVQTAGVSLSTGYPRMVVTRPVS